MSASEPTGWSRLLPRTISSRLYLILFTGLLVAHGLSFGMLFYERYESATSMMMGNLEKDVSTSIAMLDRLPAAERPPWIPKFERRTYRYILGPGQQGGELETEQAREITRLIGRVLGDRYPVRGNTTSMLPERLQVHLALSDGAPVTIELTPSVMPVARWLPYVLAAQLILLLACAWLAVRQITRPLAQLADAADSLSPTGGGPPLPTGGPTEVAKAVSAFNAMQDRIALHLKERLQILSAISHDLQTPITRLKLRVEAMDESPTTAKLVADIDEMQHLVRDGVAYARSAHGGVEPALKVDLDAFLDSLVWDYQDTGKSVSVTAHAGVPVTTRPRALRRVVGNLIDNAVKYAGAAEVAATVDADGTVAISVLDRGPGIADAELESVMEPFYRLEASRNRDTGGAGLGLAIAQQLAIAIGARLQLRGRDGGGLVATITLPAA
ncbi:HAMP domain-containing histidine kinase [Lysobacter sp. S4-A87]|uniref:HAMP domain-containing sensor histidine kinase n=1 Tax=Lysobacter sp. S4-A87 TaxID=2925843 RepID=UPI001F534D0C|nr:HAMP domain-containing sensor histidine kinase [Lysobacter sp. S4-A87]UNK49797.1 HAMP domain-containing histidine kinase [Lysobacter sp. S4-A87]